MKKIKIFLYILFLCSILSGCFKKETTKILTEDVTKGVMHRTEKETAKDLAENGSEKLGKSYVGRSFGEQVVKKAARDKTYKMMEKEGINSFLGYGKKRAANEISETEISISKKELLAASDYKKMLIERKNSNKFRGQMSIATKQTGKGVFSEADNVRILNKVASKVGLTEEKRAKLLKEMAEDPDLARLIHENPKFNTKRWLYARKPVDRKKIVKLPNGRYPVNATEFAGKTFYFNPHLNKRLMAYVKNGGTYNGYTYEQLIKLDKMYPNGIPYTEAGFPNFIKANLCYLGKNKKPLIIKMPHGFTGNRDKDFEIVREMARKQGYKINEYGYIWHHLEGNPPSMVLVKTEAHEIVKHAGGHALAKVPR